MVMIMVNIAEAKAKLSEFVDAVGRGESVIICNHNRPVAELRAIDAPRTVPRDLSPLYPGETFLTDAFFAPMTEAELADWYGPAAQPARVAEGRAQYGKSPARGKRPRRS
jgi:antitoxin (DNA-binding transcriptional repressor) of toxin-antitoxin stability system